MSPGALVIRIEGVAVGRRPLTDGTPPDRPEDVAAMVARFRSATVPILAEHGGELRGWLDSLAVEGTRDLAFTGRVFAGSDLVARLQAFAKVREGAAVSIETIETLSIDDPRASVTDTTTRLPTPYWRGETILGPNLVGLAVAVEPMAPMAPGSMMWLSGWAPEPDAT